MKTDKLKNIKANDLSEYQRSKWRGKSKKSRRILCSDDFTKYFVNIFMYLLKWPCARNTGRSGSGKNQKS